MGQVTWPCPFQGQFVVRRLGLAVINIYTKFEVSSLSRSRDIFARVELKAKLMLVIRELNLNKVSLKCLSVNWRDGLVSLLAITGCCRAEMVTKWQATAGYVANVAKKEQPYKNWLDIKRCYLKSIWRTWDETAGQPSTDWSGDYVCSSVLARAWEELAVMISK